MRFAIIGRHFKRHLDEACSRHELTGVQLMVLSRLHRLEDAGLPHVRQRDLELETHLAHPTMTELIKKLERKGFVSCAVCPSDRRSKMIASTEKARALRGQLDAIDRQVFQDLCQGISPEEQRLLLSLLDRMLQNIMEETGKDLCDHNDQKAVCPSAGI